MTASCAAILPVRTRTATPRAADARGASGLPVGNPNMKRSAA